jgi:Putative polyhydroxyalkanoic acid system protein (PHA_gran_rgn)
MSNLNITVPHQLSQDEALRRIRQYIEQAKMQYSDKITGFQEDWNGHVGAFKVSASGFSGSGNIIVNPSEVSIQSSLPLLAMAFKGRIEAFVQETLMRLLA